MPERRSGNGRDQEDQEQRHPFEQRPHVGDITGEESLHPEEDEQGYGQESAEEDKGNGGGEKGGKLFACDSQNNIHVDYVRSCAEISLKICSRLRRSGCKA